MQEGEHGGYCMLLFIIRSNSWFSGKTRERGNRLIYPPMASSIYIR